MALAHKRVLVVGGTSGIGAGVVRLAALAGAAVTSVSRRSKVSADSLANRHLVLDIADEAQVRDCLAKEAPFDHLVVTAGGAKPARFRGQGTDSAMEAFSVKFWGAWRVSALAPLAPDASITFISGVFAERPAAGQVAASCANAALEALARAMAVELGPI